MAKRKTKVKAGPKTPKGPKIEVTESPDYKVVYASGVFGGLDPNDGRIIFFLDRLKPKMKSGGRGGMELGRVEREMQVEVHMSPHEFMAISKWMANHAQMFRKKAKEGDSKDSSGTSYIG